ncbi:hypothetical protein H920_08900 [Fukomys damarensis]|uniref:Uncharacterized protein n=1 Tax=Fukomys damarensis TaxID=885580 RepID=A0A091DHL3_FUKDA|nr:hypothetical protein H920_08900 [Fukomys damarensis]
MFADPSVMLTWDSAGTGKTHAAPLPLLLHLRPMRVGPLLRGLAGRRSQGAELKEECKEAQKSKAPMKAEAAAKHRSHCSDPEMNFSHVLRTVLLSGRDDDITGMLVKLRLTCAIVIPTKDRVTIKKLLLVKTDPGLHPVSTAKE